MGREFDRFRAGCRVSAILTPLFMAERDDRRLRAFAAGGSTPEMPWFALGSLAAILKDTGGDEVELRCAEGAMHP